MAINGVLLMPTYGLRLQSCYLSTPIRKRKIIDVPGSDGNLDLLRSWEPSYANRTLTATFEVYDHRNVWPRLIDDFEGLDVQIMLPDDYGRYMQGRVHIASAGTEIRIVADCRPWIYRDYEQRYTYPAASAAAVFCWQNAGTRRVVPEIRVSGSSATIAAAGKTVTLAPGIHREPAFAIAGGAELTGTVTGGAVTVCYREASLS